MRLFIAIELAELLKASLAAFQESLKKQVPSGVSWTDPKGIHLTLKFLGETEEQRIADISAGLRRAVDLRRGPLSISLGEFGAFPSLSRPRVLWMGVQGDIDKVELLQRAVDLEMSALGFPPEDRPFQAHLTLGRVREQRGRGAAVPILRPEAAVVPAEQAVNSIALIRSQLTSRGAVYTVLETFALGQR